MQDTDTIERPWNVKEGGSLATGRARHCCQCEDK